VSKQKKRNTIIIEVRVMVDSMLRQGFYFTTMYTPN